MFFTQWISDFFSSNLRRVLQDAFLGKKWQRVLMGILIWFFMFSCLKYVNSETAAEKCCNIPVGMLLISSSSTSSYMHLLLQNGDLLLMSLPKTLNKKTKKKKASKNTSHIKFKTKGNKLSVGRLVHTLLKSCSCWGLSELFDSIKRGWIFFTNDGNLAIYFFGKSVLFFVLSHEGASRTALSCNIIQHFLMMWTHGGWWCFVL